MTAPSGPTGSPTTGARASGAFGAGAEGTAVMTGASSGFGRTAAQRIAEEGRLRLLCGGRTPAPAGFPLPLDLADRASVRGFAAEARERTGRAGIRALVLNAGVIRADADGRTADGIETTFAVNHLAPYLLLRLLLGDLAPGAAVVLTTSGAHDPATGAGLAAPRHAVAELLAHPDRDPGRDPSPLRAGQHAYTASKLCTVLLARALARRPEARERGLQVFVYDPGQMFGTGMARRLPAPARTAWRVLGSPVGAPLRLVSGTVNRQDAAGAALADLALGRVDATPPGELAALRRGRLRRLPASPRARSDALAAQLWADSARLLELPD